MPVVSSRLSWWTRVMGVSGLLCVLALQLMHVGRVTSATWDEAHHLFDGYTIWKLHDYTLNPEVPPLVKLTAAVPLLHMGLDVPANRGKPVPEEAFLDGRSFVFGNGGDRVLFPARMACGFLMLVLGLLLYVVAGEMFGVGAGLFALALLVFDPNFLAHGALITTDVGSACCFLAAVYAFYHYCRKPSWMRLVMAGIAGGLLLAAKFTGIFLFPMLVLAALLEWGLGRNARILWQRLAAVAAVGVIAWIVLWSFYGFRYKAAPEGRELNPTLNVYLGKMYDQRAARVLRMVAEHRILPEAYVWGLGRNARILWQRLGAVAAVGVIAWIVLWSFYGFRYKAAPEGRELNPTLNVYLGKMYDQRAARVLRMVAKHRILPEAYVWGLENTKNTEFEDNSYFWGRVYRHGNWEYFPVAFLVKSTLPFLLLLCLSPLAWRWGLGKKPRELGFLLIPVVVYFAISMSSDMDIGMRHLLPVYPFLYILIAGVAVTLMEHNRRWSIALAALLCWQIVTSYRVAPAYMAYGNEAWGGPSQVHRYLSDANTDWAQQLKAVKTYLDEGHISNCWFVYFADGAVEPSDYGIHCKRLPTTVSLWWLDLPMQVPPVIDGTVLISDSDLVGIEFGDGALNPYDGFRALKPTAVIQHGVYVYTGRFPVPLAAGLVEAHEAQKLAADGRLEEALEKASDAARLAPGSARVQAALGDVLAAAGKHGEALSHYSAALEAAQTVRPDLQAGFADSLKEKMERLNALQAGR